MSQNNPGELLRLSMKLKSIQPVGSEDEDLRALRQAASILEALSCLPNGETVVDNALGAASIAREAVAQRRSEAVIEKRIREGLRLSAPRITARQVQEQHPLAMAQAAVCIDLLTARQLADSKTRSDAYDRAERSLQSLRALVRKGSGLVRLAQPNNLDETTREWMASSQHDMAAFDRYVAARAQTNPDNAPTMKTTNPTRNRMTA